MFVLDTDVISRMSPVSLGNDLVREWLILHHQRSYLSTATLTELRHGAARLPSRGEARRPAILETWLKDTLDTFEGRVTPIDARIALRTGDLLARAEVSGIKPGFVDACIAATADTAGFSVVTFNAKHFAPLGIRFREPQVP